MFSRPSRQSYAQVDGGAAPARLERTKAEDVGHSDVGDRSVGVSGVLTKGDSGAAAARGRDVRLGRCRHDESVGAALSDEDRQAEGGGPGVFSARNADIWTARNRPRHR